ncbi:MAG: pyridoxamine 5'-phosphate oxidase family protein, partial [Pseudomonadota bacterium]
MFVALTGQPKILRLHGEGSVLLPNDEQYKLHAHLFSSECAPRSMILVRVTRIQDSCGYGVPTYDYQAERETLARWAGSKTPEEQNNYIREKNSVSIDGLPALDHYD